MEARRGPYAQDGSLMSVPLEECTLRALQAEWVTE